MASNVDADGKYITLQRQLSLARAEINNLRKEIKSLKYCHTKDVTNIKATLENWMCPNCSESENRINGLEELTISETNRGPLGPQEESIEMQPIGFISSGFVRKRAVPRQPNMNLSSHGKVSLYNYIFTNPEHSLEGLDGFSHMWILFHFNKNQSNHIRAKVAPPRLNGARVGVFGTRSPHRPCPIGLSLVQIDKIEGSSIYFSGVDMLDGTPVLDLKPYIPHYDNPAELSVDEVASVVGLERLELDGQESDPETSGNTTSSSSRLFLCPSQLQLPVPSEPRQSSTPPHHQREAPDGEEGQLEVASPNTLPRALSPLPTFRHVRVPDWISQSTVSPLQVTFTPQAGSLLSSLHTEENIMKIITDILREDPRSVYLRDRYANQFYTFLINSFHVSCKFDDNNHSVKVFRVVPAGTICSCGQPEWQCSIHGGSLDT